MDASKSLAELSGTDWGQAPAAASTLIRERHEFRRTPISQLTRPAFVRLLDIGGDYAILIPLALERLCREPEATDLLCAVLRADTFEWRHHPEFVHRVRDAVSATLNDIGQTTDDLERLSLEAAVYRFYSRFERNLSSV